MKIFDPLSRVKIKNFEKKNQNQNYIVVDQFDVLEVEGKCRVVSKMDDHSQNGRSFWVNWTIIQGGKMDDHS